MRRDMAQNMAKVVEHLLVNGTGQSGAATARACGLKKPTVAQWFERTKNLAEALQAYANIGEFDQFITANPGITSCALARQDWYAIAQHGLLGLQRPYFAGANPLLALGAAVSAQKKVDELRSQTPARDAAIAKIVATLGEAKPAASEPRKPVTCADDCFQMNHGTMTARITLPNGAMFDVAHDTVAATGTGRLLNSACLEITGHGNWNTGRSTHSESIYGKVGFTYEEAEALFKDTYGNFIDGPHDSKFAAKAGLTRVPEQPVAAPTSDAARFKIGQHWRGPKGHVWEILPPTPEVTADNKLLVQLVSNSPDPTAYVYKGNPVQYCVDAATGMFNDCLPPDSCSLITLVKDIPDIPPAKPCKAVEHDPGRLVYDDNTVKLPSGAVYSYAPNKLPSVSTKQLVGHCLLLEHVRQSIPVTDWSAALKLSGIPAGHISKYNAFFGVDECKVPHDGTSASANTDEFNRRLTAGAANIGITFQSTTASQENPDMTAAQDPFATKTAGPAPAGNSGQDPNIIQAVNKIMAEQKQLRAAYAAKDTELKTAQAEQLRIASLLEPTKKEAEDYKQQAAEATTLAQSMQTRLQDALAQAAAAASAGVATSGTDDEAALVHAFATTCQRAPNPLYIPGALDRFVEHCITQNKPCLLTGPSGCGKTELFQYQLSRLRQSWVQVNFDGETTRSTMVVRRSAKDGKTMFELGALPLAMLAGIPIIFDEVDHADEQCQSALHEVTRTGKLFITELNRTIIPKLGFFIGATCNSVGDATGLYSGRIGTAFKDRFTVRAMGYPSQAREVKIVMKATSCQPELAAKIAALWSDLRKMDGEALTGPFSTRQAVEIASWIMYLTSKGYPIKKATAEAIACSLTDRVTPDERKTINEVAQRHLGVDSLAEQGTGE